MAYTNLKQVLADSLMNLSYKKSIEKITVQDIVNNCKIGRQTFYYHFKDKYDLIFWMFNEKAYEILNTYDFSTNWNECLHSINEMFLKNKQFFINVAKTSGENSFARCLYEHVENFHTRSIQERYGITVLNRTLIDAISYHSYAASNIYLDWISSHMKRPSEEIVQILISNMPNDLKIFFH